MEDKEILKKKIHDAAQVIADGQDKRSVEEALNQYAFGLLSFSIIPTLPRRICISPQCGFASHSEGNRVTAEDVKRKLSLVVETSREVWSDA